MSKILSIIIPTYNAEKFLNKGLSSFLVCRDTDAQTAQHNCKMATEGRFEEIDIDKAILDKLEVIVVNDGSSDKRTFLHALNYVSKQAEAFDKPALEQALQELQEKIMLRIKEHVEGLMESRDWIFDIKSGSWVIAEQLQSEIKAMPARAVNEQKLQMFQRFLESIK
jgi:glycosyltransferase involved in cell wall biosynthesis